MIDPKGKLWGTRTTGNEVTVFSGAPGKEKETKKPQADDFSTRRFLDREEGARLRKGFVLRNPEAAPGEPSLLCHMGRDYTGALSVVECAEGLLTNCYNGKADDLYLVRRDGSKEVRASLQRGLIWSILPSSQAGEFLALVDHQVFSWRLADGGWNEMTRPNGRPASCLDVSRSRAVWYEEPNLVVYDLVTQSELSRQELAPELYSGHSPQMEAALSSDGKMLAYCAHSGQIELVEVASGASYRSITGNFAMVTKLIFSRDGKSLFVKEQYGRWTLLAFEVETGQPIKKWPACGDLGTGDVALSASGRYLAMGAYSRLEVLDLTSGEKQTIMIDQVAKRFQFVWTADDQVAVRTDAGCLGLYRIT